MKPHRLGILFLMFSPVLHGVAAAADGRDVICKTEIDAGIDDVWKAFTTKQGLQLWMAPLVEVDFAVGGKLRANYNPQGTIGDPTTFEKTILSYDPKRMIAMRPAKFPDEVLFAEAAKDTWSVFYFSQVSPTRTEITVVGVGFTSDEPSRQWRRHFETVTERTLKKLATKLKQPASTTTADGTVVLQGHAGALHRVAFSPDEKRLATASADNTVRVWDVAKGEVLLTLRGHRSPPSGEVNALAFSPDGRWIASGGSDGMIRLWNAESGNQEQTIRLKGPIGSLFYSPDGKRILTDPGPVTLVDLATGNKLLEIRQPVLAFRGVDFSAEKSEIVTAASSGKINIWDAVTGEKLRSFDSGHADLICIALGPDGKRIATGGGDKTIKLWDATTGKQLLTLKGHAARVKEIAFSPDGEHIASCSIAVKLWDVESGREELQLQAGSDGLLTVAFSPDGKRVAAGGFDHNVYLWDLNNENGE